MKELFENLLWTFGKIPSKTIITILAIILLLLFLLLIFCLCQAAKMGDDFEMENDEQSAWLEDYHNRH